MKFLIVFGCGIIFTQLACPVTAGAGICTSNDWCGGCKGNTKPVCREPTLGYSSGCHCEDVPPPQCKDIKTANKECPKYFPHCTKSKRNVLQCYSRQCSCHVNECVTNDDCNSLACYITAKDGDWARRVPVCTEDVVGGVKRCGCKIGDDLKKCKLISDCFDITCPQNQKGKRCLKGKCYCVKICTEENCPMERAICLKKDFCFYTGIPEEVFHN